MRVKAMNTASGRPAANQFVIINDNYDTYHLQSYASIVAAYDCRTGVLTLGKHWDYSVTTSAYLYKFIREYIPSLYGQIFINEDKKRACVLLAIRDGVIAYDGEMM